MQCHKPLLLQTLTTTNPTTMHHSLLLLSLTLILPLSAASSPPLHLHRRKPLEAPPQEYIEVTRPLPFESLTPSCTLPLLSHTFSNASGHHPTTANYSSPSNCSWSNAVLHLSAASNRSQRGRVAAVWLSGVEILRTTTPTPYSNGTFWNVRKDVTRYASVLGRSNLTLSLTLHNPTHHLQGDDEYSVNITLLYYNAVNTTNHGVNSSSSLELNENPADLIVPIISAKKDSDEEESFWYKIEHESDSLLNEIKIPHNTYRAVIEMYVSSHDHDEFWYTNPPDYYLEMNNLPMQRGHGSHREILLKLDDNVVGSVIPFPVIMNGGIDPLFWEPLVSIKAFDLPSYELELTPYLGTLLDGRNNFLRVEVADALSYWLVGANLHLWLDSSGDRVKAGPVKYRDPGSSGLERESNFHELDGKFKVEGERKSEVSGWVTWSAGNFTTHVNKKVEFESKIVFKRNGTMKTVKQEVKEAEEVRVKSLSGDTVAEVSRERRYPLRLRTAAMRGSENETWLISVELEHSLKEEEKEMNINGGVSRRISENRQKCRGWMFLRGCEVLSGSAMTWQTYDVRDGCGCYSRRVLAEGGAIRNDTHSALCAPPPAAAAANY